MNCPYSDCDLHKRYSNNFCPILEIEGTKPAPEGMVRFTNKTIDYLECPVYQVWREQESRLKELTGMDTKEWEELRGYQDG